MIEIENISKKYDDRYLFRNMTLKIKDNEFVCFSGQSGSGKTTLLNIIGGLEKPTEGQIFINGLNTAKSKDLNKIYADEIGFIFQNFVLVEDKTVNQNLNLIKSKHRSDISIEEALDYVGLLDKIDTKIYKLSGGEQQRVALARLLVKKCKIVLADEPTGSLDTKNAKIVMDLLLKLQSLKKALVLVTHDENLKKMAGRVVEI